jgi:uracil-DNA glycosylase
MSKCRIALVGEAWGQQEATAQHAFVGPSGRELARMLAEANIAPPTKHKYPSEIDMIVHWRNLKRDLGIELYNVYNGRPPNNDFEAMFLVGKEFARPDVMPQAIRNGKYCGDLLAPHIIHLREKLIADRPDLIICLGNIASAAVLGEARITVVRGTLSKAHYCADIKTLATFHPAHILRNWPLRPIVIADLIKAERESHSPDLLFPERWILVEPTLDQAEEWLNEPAPYFAVDVESGQALFTRLELKHMSPVQRRILAEQISMVGFARSPHEAMVMRIMSREKPDLSYYGNKADEIRAWKIIKHGLRSSVPKGFQNGLYDMMMFLAYGIGPLNCQFDTMLNHHSLFPEMQKSLGFLGSLYANVPSWKIAYAEGESGLKKDS